MSINIGPAPSEDLRPRIAVIGVGGAGGNAIANNMAAPKWARPRPKRR